MTTTQSIRSYKTGHHCQVPFPDDGGSLRDYLVAGWWQASRSKGTDCPLCGAEGYDDPYLKVRWKCDCGQSYEALVRDP